MLSCHSSPPSPSAITSSVTSTASTESSTFGDLLANLLHSLPEEAALELLKSLRGLSSQESQELCEYLHILKPQKQFRVITAMANSQLEGKLKFLKSLGDKVSLHQRMNEENGNTARKYGHQEGLILRMKKQQVEKAASRVKIMNHGNKNFHSFNAIFPNYSVPSKHGNACHLRDENSANALKDENRFALKDGKQVTRSLSSSSVTRIVTPADLAQMNEMLHSTTLEDSERRLRELEKDTVLRSKKDDAAGKVERHDDGKRSDERKRFQSSCQGFLSQSQSHKSHSQHSFHVSSRHHKTSNMSEMSNSNNVTKTVKTYRTFKTVSTTYTKSNMSRTHKTSAPTTEPVDDTAASCEYSDPEAPKAAKWTKHQDDALRYSVQLYQERNWKAIAELVPNRNHAQCLQRWRKVLKPGLVKGHWSHGEDQILEALIYRGYNNWSEIAQQIPGRTPKQCRERWKNHLNPMINKGPYTEEEDQLLLQAQYQMGNKWSQIAQMIPGRTEDSVKIRFKSLQQNPQKAIQSYAQSNQIEMERATSMASGTPLHTAVPPAFMVSVSVPTSVPASVPASVPTSVPASVPTSVPASDLIHPNIVSMRIASPLPPQRMEMSVSGSCASDLLHPNRGAPPLPPQRGEDGYKEKKCIVLEYGIRRNASLDPYIYDGRASPPISEVPYVALSCPDSNCVDVKKRMDTAYEECVKTDVMHCVAVESVESAQSLSESIGFSNVEQRLHTFPQPLGCIQRTDNIPATTQSLEDEELNMQLGTLDDEDEAIFNQLAQELEQETLDFASIFC
uniref:Myblike DNAbinding protein putative n=1 Tax=Albugo laibachii Nc14 TaxID=890382 RepID=F0WRH8_9STRA|nr:myblike DNAbinding protein putative [Albugo laibachii Nc14]|eukprot:CCA23941.1 myblike DNAbinding protein putative [Albugo laibachii Nc14]